MKESPQEIGFAIGALLGFLWLVYENTLTTRSSGTANWILIMLCGLLGGGAGWLIGRLF